MVSQVEEEAESADVKGEVVRKSDLPHVILKGHVVFGR